MATTSTHLVLTDGATSVNLAALIESGTWGPAIAAERNSGLSNQSRYADVFETMTAFIQGATPAAVQAQVSTIDRLLKQARRWEGGDRTVAPVRLEYNPKGAQFAAPGHALILGNPNEGEQAVTLPLTWDEQTYNYVRGLALAFLRRGEWLFNGFTTLQLLHGSAFDSGLQGWNTYFANGNAGSLYIVPGAGAGTNGGKVVTVDMTATSFAGDGPNRQVRSPQFSVTNGDIYNFSMEWVAASGAQVAVQVYSNAAAAAISNTVTLTAGGAGTFPKTRAQAELAITQTRADAFVIILLYIGGTGQIFYMAEPLLTTRYGLNWHRSNQDDTVATVAAAAGVGSVLEVAFQRALNRSAPLNLELGPVAAGGAGATLATLPRGLLLYSYAANRFVTYEAELMTPTNATWSNVTEANARTGGVKRYTPAGTTFSALQGMPLSGLALGIQTIGVYAVVRVNGNYEYTMQAVTNTQNVGVGGDVAPIAYNNGQPQIVALGEITREDGFASLDLYVTAMATGGTLDIDYILVAAAEADEEGVLAYEDISISPRFDGTSVNLALRHELLSGWAPFFGAVDSNGVYASRRSMPKGDTLAYGRGLNVAAVWMATQGANWTPVRVDGTAVTMGLRVTRSPSSLTPGGG